MDLSQRLLKLVATSSVTGHEAPLCELLLAELARYDTYTIERVGNAFALRPRERRCPQLVALAGHLDTVPPSADNPPRIEGDRLYGLGSADMKSGLALMWQLLAEPVVEPAYDLAFIFYDGEEGPYETSGLGPLLDRLDWLHEIDLAFCIEPSDNVLHLGCMGTLHAEVTFVGRPAHSARPWQGVNAIYKAAGLLQRLAELQPLDVVIDGLTYREVMSATTAHGGTAPNVIPDRFVLNLNYRFAPNRSLESAQHAVRAMIAGEAELRFTDLAPAGAVPLGNPVLERFRAVTRVPAAPKQAWTDVARLTAAGIAAVNFGPGDNAQAHQPHESTSLSALREGDRLFRRFLTAES